LPFQVEIPLAQAQQQTFPFQVALARPQAPPEPIKITLSNQITLA
jgi:hypothetical protein